MENYKRLDIPEINTCLFHPRQTGKPQKSEHCYDIDIKVDKDTTLGCRLYLNDSQSPTILYFHGNGETVPEHDDIGSAYKRFGINLFVATYRGYGWSTGVPSIGTMMRDCHSIAETLTSELPNIQLTGPLFVMGRSLGSVSALELCASSADLFKGVIIESGFAETLPLLQSLGLDLKSLAIEEANGFNNLEKITQIKLPTLILHGAADELIPVPQAEKLQSFSGARTKKFFVIPGAGHNEIIVKGGEHYFMTIRDFIHEVTGQNSWRERRKKFKKADPK